MLSEREVSAAVGSTAYGANGDKLGTVEHFYVDDRTGAPTWVSVTTGLFGTRHSVVPAVDAAYDEDDGSLRLPVSAEAVKNAPHLAGDHLDPAEEAELRRHYGIPDTGIADPGIADHGLAGPGPAGADVAAGTPGRLPPVPPSPGGRHESAGLDDRRPGDRSAEDLGGTEALGKAGDLGNTAVMAAPTQEIPAVPPPPPADAAHETAHTGAMTRSEEQLRIGTERVATTRARLVKYVVTEEVQITVPIRREEIRIEEVPLDAPDPGPGESLTDDSPTHGSATPDSAAHDQGRPGTAQPAAGQGQTGGLPEEIVLHTERPVVTVEVVPVERVRLRTETVEGQERVSGQVQREQIVLDESSSPRHAGP